MLASLHTPLVWGNHGTEESHLLPLMCHVGEVQLLSWGRLVRCPVWPEATTEQETQGQESFLAAFRNVAWLHKYMPGHPASAGLAWWVLLAAQKTMVWELHSSNPKALFCSKECFGFEKPNPGDCGFQISLKLHKKSPPVSLTGWRHQACALRCSLTAQACVPPNATVIRHSQGWVCKASMARLPRPLESHEDLNTH